MGRVSLLDLAPAPTAVPVLPPLRIGLVSGIDELDELLGMLEHDQEFPAEAEGPRGRQGSPGRVVLPEHWLDDPDDASVPAGAELPHSGG